MAMKFVRATTLFVLSWLCISCGSTPTKNRLDLEPAEVGLLSSDAFIPVISKDKDGLPLPYQPAPDPYSSQKGRIDKDAIVQFIESKRHFSSGNDKQASSIASSLIESEPKLSGPWVVLGDVAFRKEEFIEAEDHYLKAIQININNINAYLKLALAQRKQGKYLIAQNTYVAALEQWSDFPEAHLNLAVLYDLYLNHPIRAQRHYEAYQFLTDGRDAVASKWLAEINQRTGMSFNLKVGDDKRPEVVSNE